MKSALAAAMGVWAFTGMVAPAAATPTGQTKFDSYSGVEWDSSLYNHFDSVADTLDDYYDANFGPTDVDFLAFVYSNRLYTNPDLQLSHAGLSISGSDLSGDSGNWIFKNGPNTDYKIVAVELLILDPSTHDSNDMKTIVYRVDPSSNNGSWDTSDFVTDKYKKSICKITLKHSVIYGSGDKKKSKQSECPSLLKIAFYGTTVKAPEPASIALFATGLVGFGLRRRKKA